MWVLPRGGGGRYRRRCPPVRSSCTPLRNSGAIVLIHDLFEVFFSSLLSCLLLFYSLAASLTSAASTSTLRSERGGDWRKHLRRCSSPPVFQKERAPISPEVAPVLISDGGMERCVMDRPALVILASSDVNVGIVLHGGRPLFRLSSQEVTWKCYQRCLFKHISPICIRRPGEITCVSGCHGVFWSSGIPK